MDNLKELSKNLKATQNNTNYALQRNHPIYPLIHRSRDIFDYVIPFEMEFSTFKNDNFSLLNLTFAPPPPSDCNQGGCFVGICEFYKGTDTVLTLTYPYLSNTLFVYVEDIVTANFSETGASEVTLGFTPSAEDAVKVCYIYEIEGCTST